jgi:hypothetical protein
MPPSTKKKSTAPTMDTGEDMDLFQAHWDVPLPPDTLVGLTVEEARRRRAERMLAAAGAH